MGTHSVLSLLSLTNSRQLEMGVQQRDIDQLSKWADRNLIKFSKGKYQSPLLLGKNNPTKLSNLWADWLESNFTENSLGFLLNNKNIRKSFQCECGQIF